MSTHTPPIPLLAEPPLFTHQEQEVIDDFLEAYRHGAFPMAEPSINARGRPRNYRRIDWYIPDPRATIPIDVPINATGVPSFHISRSLARRLRKGWFTMTCNTAFEQVIRGCAEPAPGREDTWLDERLIRSYTLLHRAGYVHSIEAWLPGPARDEHTLVGGVYGLALGSAFCAESMFCRPEIGGTDASKVCLAYLVRHLQQQGFHLLDAQIANRHTTRLGVVEIPDSLYQQRLRDAIAVPRSWGTFDPVWQALPPAAP